MKSNFIRWDSLFSYWILCWFFVYMFSSFYTEFPLFEFIYENTNPLILFIFALLSSIKNTLIIITNNPFSQQLPFHISKFFVIKLIPLFILYNQKIKVIENLIFSLFSFFTYLFYLFIMNKNIFQIYKELENQIKNNKSNTSLEYVIEKMNTPIQF